MKPGSVIHGRYRIEEMVGQGGMAAVYRAIDGDEGVVAIKWMRRNRDRTSERFAREAKVLRSLDHPGIVRYLDTGVTDEGGRFLVMEWLDGEDLGARLRRGRLSLEESLALVVRVTEALAYAHERGVVHRDIKPGNIFLPRAGAVNQAKLLDFGSARLGNLSSLTATGSQIGTPMYMAPEQVRGDRQVGMAADIFSLGCVLFECLTGQIAFEGGQLMAIFYKILVEEPPRLAQLIPGTPAVLDELVARMMAKDPATRPSSAAALGDEIARMAETLQIALTDEHWQAMVDRSYEDDSLTRTERRLVCAVMVAGNMPIHDWLESRDQPPDEDEVDLALDQTLPESSGLDGIQNIFVRMGARFDELGDGSLIAVFEGRGAATDRAVHAARCALQLSHAFPEKSVSVATGRAYVARERVLGEVIERAIALLDPAVDGSPPGIRIDRTTADLVRVRFALEEHGEHIELASEYEQLDELAEPRVLGKATPFVGRRRELATLHATLEQCLDESSSQAIVITGVSGVGKSRLGREFARSVVEHDEDIALWRGSGDAMSASAALGAIAHIVRRLADIRADEPLSVRRGKLRKRIAATVDVGHVAHTTVFLGEIVGTRWSDDDHPMLRSARRDPQAMSDQVRRAFVTLVRAELATRPLVIAIDDLHWCDRATVELLDRTLVSLNDAPLFLVAFGREEVRTLFPDLWLERGTTLMRLRPLARRAATRLVHAVMGRDNLDQATLDQLLERGQGNPLFLEELMRSAATGRGISDTLFALIEDRLDTLTPGIRRTLRAASIFGKRFWRGGVQRMLGSDPSLATSLEVLIQDEYIVHRDASRFVDEHEFAFRHDLVRQAAYQMLTPEDRTLGHRLAGEWLELAGESNPLLLAEHFEIGQARERAATLFLRAAQDAYDANALENAIALAERGVACDARGQLLGRLRSVQAGAHVWHGELQLAETRSREAMELLPPESRDRYIAAEHLCHSHARRDSIAAHDELTATLASGCPEGHDREAWLMLASSVARTLYHRSRHPAARVILDLVESELLEATTVAEPGLMGRIHAARAGRAAFERHDLAEAMREYQGASIHFEQAGNVRNACLERIHAGWLLGSLGLYTWSIDISHSALGLAEELGNTGLCLHARTALGRSLVRQGQLAEGCARLRQVVESPDASANPTATATAHTILARTMLMRGQLDDAERQARAALNICTRDSTTFAPAAAALSRALLAHGMLDEALRLAAEANHALANIPLYPDDANSVRLTRAEVLHAAGRSAEAERVIIDARERLLAQAATIQPDQWCQNFLEDVADNARIMELHEKLSRAADD